MNQAQEKDASFEKADQAGNQSNQDDKKSKEMQKQAGRIANWVGGLMFAFLPVGMCLFFGWLHADNATVSANYSNYISEFFVNGSFLWISISALATSLFDLLLYGFRDGTSDKDKFKYKIYIAIDIILVFAGIDLYLNNISSPISSNKMMIMSIVLFIFYAISSGIVTFKIMQEV